MASPVLRPVAPDEFATFVHTGEAAFGERVSGAQVEHERAVFEFDRSLAAFDDGGRLVGTSGAFTTRQRVPGTELDVAVVTWVSVARDQRRRGILTAMMRGLYGQARERGEPLLSLFASEASIYGRFGFGPATHDAFVTLERRATRIREDAPSGGVLRAIERRGAAATLGPIYAAARAGYTGMPSRSAGWWDYQVLHDEPEPSPGVGPKEVAVHERGGRLDGYVVSRLRDRDPDGVSDRTLDVLELVALTPEAHTDLWRYCLDADLSQRLLAHRRPRSEALAHLLVDPRQARADVYDGLYLAFVDLPSALGARRWTGSDRLRIEVLAPFWPDAAGTWELAVTDGHATSTRTSAEADLVVDAPALAMAYLGETRPHALRLAGRLRERTDGASGRLDRLLGATEPPWAPEDF